MSAPNQPTTPLAAPDDFNYESLRIGAALPEVRTQFEDFAGRNGYDIAWGELPSGYHGYLQPDTAKAFQVFHGGMRARPPAPVVTMSEEQLLDTIGMVLRKWPDGYTMVQYGQEVLARAQVPVAPTYAEGIQEGVRRAFDTLMFAAVNTDNEPWSDKIEDMALDVLEYAPDYKTKWKEITDLYRQISELKAQLAKASERGTAAT